MVAREQDPARSSAPVATRPPEPRCLISGSYGAQEDGDTMTVALQQSGSSVTGSLSIVDGESGSFTLTR